MECDRLKLFVTETWRISGKVFFLTFISSSLLLLSFVPYNIYNNNNSKAFVSAFKILNALTARSENSQSFI